MTLPQGENGLLRPVWVDPDSGYRYYAVAQIRDATLIALLRRAGMPLTDIRAFIRDPSVDRLDAYERRLADELAEGGVFSNTSSAHSRRIGHTNSPRSTCRHSRT